MQEVILGKDKPADVLWTVPYELQTGNKPYEDEKLPGE
jgi:hypothetical protein